jgi:hypothetical protein
MKKASAVGGFPLIRRALNEVSIEKEKTRRLY